MLKLKLPLFLGCILLWSGTALADGPALRERPFSNLHKEYDVIENNKVTGTIKEVPFTNKPTFEIFNSDGEKVGTVTKKPFTNKNEYEYEGEGE